MEWAFRESGRSRCGKVGEWEKVISNVGVGGGEWAFQVVA